MSNSFVKKALKYFEFQQNMLKDLHPGKKSPFSLEEKERDNFFKQVKEQWKKHQNIKKSAEEHYVTEVDLSLDEIFKDTKTETYDLITKKVKVKWSLELEARSWGIKSVIISVPDQDIAVKATLQKYDAAGKELGEEDVEKVLNLKDVKVNEEYVKGLAIFPKELELYKGKYTLTF